MNNSRAEGSSNELSDGDGSPTSNPLARSAQITVTVPETVEINLVNASVLEDYELWSLVGSILSSGCIGFFVAFMQSSEGKGAAFGWMSLVLFVVTVIAIGTALHKRSRLKDQEKTQKFNIGEPVNQS